MGSLILDQVVWMLIKHQELHLASTVLLTGSSAGGIGVMLNIDRIQNILLAAESSAEVRGVADSGWYLLRPKMEDDVSLFASSSLLQLFNLFSHISLTVCFNFNFKAN